MNAIETWYNGTLYKSRLEAKWAVFMTLIGVKFQYEPEGYALSDGVWYLPDFWLPDMECWIEIKGQIPTEEEQRKMELLVEDSQKNGYIFYGELPNYAFDYMWESDSAYVWKPEWIKEYGIGICFDHGHVFCQCPQCGKIGIQYMGRVERLACSCYDADKEKCFGISTPVLLKAYQTARNYRFEEEYAKAKQIAAT